MIYIYIYIKGDYKIYFTIFSSCKNGEVDVYDFNQIWWSENLFTKTLPTILFENWNLECIGSMMKALITLELCPILDFGLQLKNGKFVTSNFQKVAKFALLPIFITKHKNLVHILNIYL